MVVGEDACAHRVRARSSSSVPSVGSHGAGLRNVTDAARMSGPGAQVQKTTTRCARTRAGLSQTVQSVWRRVRGLPAVRSWSKVLPVVVLARGAS